MLLRQGHPDQCSIDFVVDGVPLSSLVTDKDLRGRLSPDPEAEWNPKVLQILQGEAPADEEEDRVMLYLCAECGDLACGALTCRIVRTETTVEWSDFAFENGYNPDMTDREFYAGVGPFQFEAEQYRAALESAVAA
ncbi:MAG: hypothetical protein ACTHOH_12790 [Lysobacteraceae bacterium]